MCKCQIIRPYLTYRDVITPAVYPGWSLMEAPKYPDRNGRTDLNPLPVWQKKRRRGSGLHFNDK